MISLISILNNDLKRGTFKKTSLAFYFKMKVGKLVIIMSYSKIKALCLPKIFRPNNGAYRKNYHKRLIFILMVGYLQIREEWTAIDIKT